MRKVIEWRDQTFQKVRSSLTLDSNPEMMTNRENSAKSVRFEIIEYDNHHESEEAVVIRLHTPEHGVEPWVVSDDPSRAGRLNSLELIIRSRLGVEAL
jgi:hypothetical protein